MQTLPPNTLSLFACARKVLLFLLFALHAVGASAVEDAAFSRPPANSFRLIQLSSDPFASAALNARGQAAFITTRQGAARAQFFDGRRIHDLGTLGGTNLSVAGLNALGQAVFNVDRSGTPRVILYDGHRLRDLGTLGGPGATAAGLNDHGQVAGISGRATGGTASHVFRWSEAGGMADLGVPGEGDPVVYGINDRGQIFGRASFSGGPWPSTHGFFWSQRSGLVDIGALGDFTVPTAMNDAGTMVGYGGHGPQRILGFRWNRAAGLSDMGTLPDEFTWAVHINNAGHIVGATPFIAQDYPHPFLWTPEHGLLDLGTGTAQRGAGTKVNRHDMVIGYLFTAFTLSHGFIWTREMGLIELGAASSQVLSSADDVNERGHVVGSLDMRAYRWTRSQGVVDLNTLIPPTPDKVVLRSAHAIAENGAILARADSGLYLLVPADHPYRPLSEQ